MGKAWNINKVLDMGKLQSIDMVLLWTENFCASKIQMQKLNLQCVGIKRWGLWGVIIIRAFIKKNPESSFAPIAM